VYAIGSQQVLACSTCYWYLTTRLKVAILIKSLRRAEEPVRALVHVCKEATGDLEEPHQLRRWLGIC
jgi:hypothetical protein